MITFDTMGNIIPNFGEYKDPDEYEPAVLYFDKKDDYKTFNELLSLGDIVYGEWADEYERVRLYDFWDGTWKKFDSDMIYTVTSAFEKIQTMQAKKLIRR